MSSRLSHAHELPGYLKFVYVYHFFNVRWRVSEMLANLIWSTRFEMAVAWTENKKKLTPIFKFINFVLCWSEFNCNHHCANEAKEGKVGAHEGYSRVSIIRTPSLEAKMKETRRLWFSGCYTVYWKTKTEPIQWIWKFTYAIYFSNFERLFQRLTAEVWKWYFLEETRFWYFKTCQSRIWGDMQHCQEIKLLSCFQKQGFYWNEITEPQTLQTLSTILNLKNSGHLLVSVYPSNPWNIEESGFSKLQLDQLHWKKCDCETLFLSLFSLLC